MSAGWLAQSLASSVLVAVICDWVLSTPILTSPASCWHVLVPCCSNNIVTMVAILVYNKGHLTVNQWSMVAPHHHPSTTILLLAPAAALLLLLLLIYHLVSSSMVHGDDGE
mgnify:FL=1